MKTNKFVVVTTRFRGLHSWPECTLDDVSFLKFPHHHEFFVEATIETPVDRAFEFILTQQLIEAIIMDTYPNFNKTAIYRNQIVYTAKLDSRSCETIAEEIACKLGAELCTNVSIVVSEDGHYGGKAFYRTKHTKQKGRK